MHHKTIMAISREVTEGHLLFLSMMEGTVNQMLSRLSNKLEIQRTTDSIHMETTQTIHTTTE